MPTFGGLRDVKPFPVSYILKRDEYQIVVRAYERDPDAAAILSVNAITPMTLKIADTSGSDGSHCLVAIERHGSVKFGWSCEVKDAARQYIVVAVVDASGAQVAVEEFSFTVVENGRSCLKDGL